MTVTGAESTVRGWTADDSTFGARLALIRQRMGWGNVKLAAEECKLPVQSWRTWERDGVTPRNIVEIAGTISERTGCDYGWLLAGHRLTTYATPRSSAVGSGINGRSAALAKRLHRGSTRTRTKRTVIRSHLKGRPQKGTAASASTRPPTQRRPTLITRAG